MIFREIFRARDDLLGQIYVIPREGRLYGLIEDLLNSPLLRIIIVAV